jgi:cysteine synthase
MPVLDDLCRASLAAQTPGVSTGLNVVEALQLARELGPGHTVATAAVDTGLKYLAGDLYQV